MLPTPYTSFVLVFRNANRRGLRTPLLRALTLACLSSSNACTNDGTLPDSVDQKERDAAKPDHQEPPEQQEPDAAVAYAADAGIPFDRLPGMRFDFALNGIAYIDLSTPSVIQPTSSDTFAWDLLFDGLTVYTNSGAAGPGYGASFGPSSELDLLFDAAPAVPLRADVSDNALLSWYWFGPNGVTSRFHTYALRNAEGQLFKLQVLSYYDNSGNEQRTAIYTVRYAEVTPDGSGEIVEVNNLDASAGGVTLPPSSPAACIDLAAGTLLQLDATEWSSKTDWDLCFQRTEVFLNGGLSGKGSIEAVDLDLEPGASVDSGVTEAEQRQTPEGALARFEEVDYAMLTQQDLPWDQQYEARARIGTRWLAGEPESPVPQEGSWIVRGADGERHYALYFISVSPETQATRTVSVQVKPLAPPTITE